MTINTPLIDAAINIPQRGYLQKAKAILAADVVYNVDFGLAKCWLRDSLEAALKPIVTKFWESHRGDYSVQYIDLSSYVQLNHCKGLPKKLKKYAKLPEIQEYLAIVAEGSLLFEAVEAAKARVKKGRVPSANPTPIDLTNTGTCSICRNQQKLTGEKKMVHHGYRISEGGGNYYGMRIGRCFGCDYLPYELSCDGNIAYRKMLNEELAKAEAYHKKLDNGEITVLTRLISVRENSYYTQKMVEYKHGEKGWDVIFESECREIDGKIRFLKSGIRQQTEYINKWKKSPLPGDVK